MGMNRRAKPFTGTGEVIPAGNDVSVVGVVVDGFTKVLVFNGTDNTGDLVAATAVGTDTVHLPEPVACPDGVYVEATGGPGKGSVLA